MKLAKLLLIEDNQEAADLIKHILEAAGYHVEHKTLGMDGLT